MDFFICLKLCDIFTVQFLSQGPLGKLQATQGGRAKQAR